MADRLNIADQLLGRIVGRKSAAPSAVCTEHWRKALRFSALRVPITSTLAGLLLTGVAAADLNDPTRPPPGFSEQGKAADAPDEAPLVVSSLFLMGAKPYAVVDGQIVRLGDPLAGGKVGKIDASGVWIASPASGKTRTRMRLLAWLPNIVKMPARSGEVKKTPPAARTEKK